MSATNIKINWGSDTYVLSADFAQAADTLRLDGRNTPYQVADASHDYDKAVALVMEWAIRPHEEIPEDHEWEWEIAEIRAVNWREEISNGLRSFAADEAMTVSQGIYEDAIRIADEVKNGELSQSQAEECFSELRERLSEAVEE